MTEPRKKRSLFVRWMRLLFRLFSFALVLALLGGAGGFYWAYQKFGKNLPDISVLENYRPAETTKILSSDGQVIATLYQENRVWAPLDSMGQWVVPALLATEDSRFFEHSGVDFKGIARVLYNIALTREVREGASTITMQLSRSLFPMSEVSWERKIREMFLSHEIEKRYGKERILELYLNQVYFGGGAHGIHSAARVYFNKGPGALTLSESALIAGLIQAPTRFSPLDHPERAFHRQDEVLGRMRAVQAITQAQYDEAIAEREQMKFTGIEKRAFEVDKFPYFSSYVIKELSDRYSEDELYRGGLTIVTTIDPQIQREAQHVLTEETNALAWELNVETGALVLVENGTGYIKAMVGGLGWTQENQFNRAYQTRRQPGSSFKPATYGAALEAGFTPESRVNDSPVKYQDGSREGWAPKNSDGRHLGVITLRTALQGSRNVPAVKILDAVGVERVVDLGYRMGIRSQIPANLSIALGAISASPLEMAEFYSVIANGGRRIAPTAVKVVKDSEGKILEDNRQPSGQVVLKEETALALTSMLGDVVRAGTGTNAQVAGWPIAGKTGTTDSFVDAWFCGFSPYYTCTVWVGNDDNKPMYRSYGGDLPATVFRRVMTFAHKDLKPRDFKPYVPSKDKARDILKAGEAPTPTPTPSGTPVVVETPSEPLPELTPAEPQPEFTPPPGKSYLLPETLEDGPAPEPVYEPEPVPIVTPALLPPEPEEVNIDAAIDSQAGWAAPSATEVSFE